MVGKSASGFEHLTRGNQTSYSSLAQSVEHLTVNQGVAGSSPAGGANENHAKWRGFFVGSPSCTRTLHPARQRRGQGAEFLLNFCRREPKGSKFVAWFDVQKRASTLGGSQQEKRSPTVVSFLVLFLLELRRSYILLRPKGGTGVNTPSEHSL